MVAVFLLFIDNVGKHCSSRSAMTLLSQSGDSLSLLCVRIILENNIAGWFCTVMFPLTGAIFQILFSWVAVTYTGFTGEEVFLW